MVKSTLKYYKVVPTDLGCDAYGSDPCLICGKLTDEMRVADSFGWVRHTLEPVDDDEAVAWMLDGKPMLGVWLQGVLNRPQKWEPTAGSGSSWQTAHPTA